jgi:hypothetical protein
MTSSTSVDRPADADCFWYQRDAAIEEEVIRKGSYADTVFLCAGSTSPSQVEQVFGQSALFALLSPVLRDRLDSVRIVNQEAPVLREVWLADEITARGFEEVARYVYRLRPRFNMLKLAEVAMAARILQIPELDQAALRWGLAKLETLVIERGQAFVSDAPPELEEGPFGALGDALSFFGVLCLPVGDVGDVGDGVDLQSRYGTAVAWREALIKAFDPEKIAECPAFLELPEEAMLLLLESEAIHTKPSYLWEQCVRWALLRKERETPVSKQPPFCAGPSFETPPKKLFAPGARLVTVSVPKPADHEVDWQRWLLPVAERIQFKDMSAGAFAAHMEAINPMLPELRQVIYRVRRLGIRFEAAGKSSPIDRLLLESD